MKQNNCLKYMPKIFGINHHQGFNKMFNNQLCYKVYTVIKSSEVKTIKVCKVRWITIFAKSKYIFINLNSVIKMLHHF